MHQNVIDLTSRLVELDSVNPSLVEGGRGEVEVARYVVDWARHVGLGVDVLEATRGRPSVVVRAPGWGGGRTLLLCAHTDTVGVGGMVDPHTPRVDADRLYGRGAYDMKSGLAAALLAIKELARAGLAGDVVVAAVADEEHASLGVQEVLAAVRADAAIVTEPTELELVVAHKGFVWSEIELRGRAAHGSRHEQGVDAIAAAGPVLTGIAELDAALATREPHPLLGRGSVHASVIEGGAEMSSYPAHCAIGLERRTLPGETAATVEAEVDELIASATAANRALEASQRTLLIRAPFDVPHDADVVEAVRGAAGDILGAPPPLAGAPYWADAAFIAAAGIPTVMFGASGAGAHAVEEWVSIDDTVKVVRTLIAAGRRLCA